MMKLIIERHQSKTFMYQGIKNFTNKSYYLRGRARVKSIQISRNTPRLRIIFSEMIRKNLLTGSSSKGLSGSAVSSPIGGLGLKLSKILAKMLSKSRKIVHSLILFRVRYKRFVTLTTFPDSL